jgi:predicted AAA+ superfamily ATPase
VIDRRRDADRLRQALDRAPVALLTGPRQAGKSTLARAVVDPAPSHIFDLEDPEDAARLAQPGLALRPLEGTVVIDEAQRQPDLFPVLRVLVDEDRRPGRFLVLGSASPDLVGLGAESLAGRVALLELSGFGLRDVGIEALDRLWLRGGLPPSFLAGSDQRSRAWRDDYVRTFLERDLAQLGFRTPATTMRRFWTMVAHYHGQTWNGAELARSLGVSQPTVRRQLDALTDALVVRQLHPWYANVGKRQIRSPKIYVRDTGLLHTLLRIADLHDLFGHPKMGASWEGFVIEQLLAMGDAEDPWFWGTHRGAELDLFITVTGQPIGVEIKRTETPSVTPSMRHALTDLDLTHLIVIHAGQHRFPLSDDITAVPAADVLTRGIPAAIEDR